MIDTAWQLQAIASVVVAVPVGVALRRAVDELDRQRDERHAHRRRRETAGSR